jgi:hypothetical protein
LKHSEDISQLSCTQASRWRSWAYQRFGTIRNALEHAISRHGMGCALFPRSRRLISYPRNIEDLWRYCHLVLGKTILFEPCDSRPYSENCDIRSSKPCLDLQAFGTGECCWAGACVQKGCTSTTGLYQSSQNASQMEPRLK